MSVFHGKGGSAAYGVSAAEVTIEFVTDWSIDITGDVAEKTAMSDTPKTYIPGFVDWTATVTCRADDTGGVVDALFNGSVNSLLITAASSEVFAGDAIMTGINPSADKDDVATVTYVFQGSGALTFDAVAVI